MFEYGFAMAAADAGVRRHGADHPWVLDAANGYVDAGVAYAATSFDAAKAYYAAVECGSVCVLMGRTLIGRT